jgi:hypothetical protein
MRTRKEEPIERFNHHIGLLNRLPWRLVCEIDPDDIVKLQSERVAEGKNFRTTGHSTSRSKTQTSFCGGCSACIIRFEPMISR